MSEQPALPAPESAETDPPPPPAPPRHRGLLHWLYGLGFLILAAAIFYVWQYPDLPADTGTGAPDARITERKLEAIDTRLSRLEQQPRPPSAADLGKITAQLDALEARVSDQTRLSSRLDVLSGRIESLSGVNQSGIDVIRQQLESSSSRLTAVEKTTGGELESGIDAIKKQLDETAARLAVVEKSAGGADAATGRLDRIARIQAASLALANGQPLGDLPDAPPALSRYANAAPPTMAHLRLTFPQMERAAIAAGQSASGNGAFVDRVWERAQGLVTVRQGDEVVVGNGSAVVLARAGVALEAGDLAGAVRETVLLNPSALHAATDWLAEAKALVDARAALTNLAAHI